MYKVYIISLINSGHGEHLQSAHEWLPQSLDSCRLYGYEVEIFTAINGHTLDATIWEKYNIPYPKKSVDRHKKFIGDLPGAQGCFLSHYMLWNKCVSQNTAIIVLEDDAIMTARIQKIGSDLEVIKLHAPTRTGQSKLGEWSAGAFAYLIYPTGAQKLINHVKLNGPQLADKLISSSIVNWGYASHAVVKLGARIGSSTQPEKYPYVFT